MVYDVIIVGGGPAGLTAGLYTSRAKLNTLIIEKKDVGSLVMAHKIDNYPGFPEGISGKDLYNLMKEQAKRFGAEFVDATVLDFDVYSEEDKIVKTDKGNFKGKKIIIATGTGNSDNKKIKGEKEFLGNGVSYCATCDGAFTKFMEVALFGKGEEVAEEALFLTKFAKKIRVFVNDKILECNKDVFDALNGSEKVEIIYNSELVEIKGNEYVESVDVKVDGELKNYSTAFAFLYLGTKSKSEMYGAIADLDEHGFIKAKDNFKINVDGVYVAGDVRSGAVRQVTVAVAEGTLAGLEVIKEVLKKK